MVTEGHKDRVPRCERRASARDSSLTELKPFFLRMWVTADLELVGEQNLLLSPPFGDLAWSEFSLSAILSRGSPAIHWPVVSRPIFEIDLCSGV